MLLAVELEDDSVALPLVRDLDEEVLATRLGAQSGVTSIARARSWPRSTAPSVPSRSIETSDHVIGSFAPRRSSVR